MRTSPDGLTISRAPRAVALALILCAAASAWGQRGASQYFQTTSLPEGRQMHGAAVIGDFMYVVGGRTGTIENPDNTQRALMAPVDAEGRVGQWQETTPLRYPLLYIGNSTVTRGPIVYVCGGNVYTNDQTINESSRVVTMAAQGPDGNLSHWLTSDAFPGPGVQAAAAVATRTHLYVIGGGDTDNQPQPVVYIAPFAGGGLLGPWQRGPDLPRGLWFHMAGTASDRIYVWGGTNPAGAAGAVNTTYVADIQPDGTLSAWRTLPPLPARMYFSASASLDDTLFNFSGKLGDDTFTNDVLFAIPDRSGSVAWERVRANVPLNRYLAPAPDPRRGIIYLPGGRGPGNDLIADVFGYRVPRFEVADAFGVPTGETTATPEPTPASTGTGEAPTVAAVQLGGGWTNYAQAELQAARSGRNMMLYFQTPFARRCRDVEERVFSDPGFQDVAGHYALASVDAASERGLAVTYGVYRVPTVVIVSPQGRPLASFVRDFSLRDLRGTP